MFTGIVENLLKVLDINKKRITVENVYNDILNGESIAVNGVCLTVTASDKTTISFDISEETYSKTNFKYIKNGDLVNIERALKLGSRLGGHIVSGHIDEVGEIKKIKELDGSYIITVSVSNTKYVVEKGSVCVNGISLTSFNVKPKSFDVSVIPHTFENTNIKLSAKNKFVNIEFDIIAKYLKKDESKITLDFLKNNGFV